MSYFEALPYRTYMNLKIVSQPDPLPGSEENMYFRRMHTIGVRQVFPRAPDSQLVDEPCVRLNLLFRDGELHCESYSFNRDLLARRILTNLEEGLGRLVAFNADPDPAFCFSVNSDSDRDSGSFFTLLP